MNTFTALDAPTIAAIVKAVAAAADQPVSRVRHEHAATTLRLYCAGVSVGIITAPEDLLRVIALPASEVTATALSLIHI